MDAIAEARDAATNGMLYSNPEWRRIIGGMLATVVRRPNTAGASTTAFDDQFMGEPHDDRKDLGS